MHRLLFFILLAASLSSGCRRGSVAVAALPPAAGQQDAADAADWPEFLGPARDDSRPRPGCSRASPHGLPVVWEQPLGTGYSAPSVRGGLLVLHHRGR